jgi:NDP-sugar pyrophosphorylase family protein
MLLTFASEDPRYSYVEVGSDGAALRTAEKVVISNQAILGGYYFSSGKLFKDLADSFVANPLPDGLREYFLSHLFNMLIAENRRVEIARLDKKYIFGTPEELRAYTEGTQ